MRAESGELASMPMSTGSGGRLRKAMPSAMASTTGKPKVQKMALGSRKKLRQRVSVSCQSGLLTELPPRQGDEHVFEGRVMRRQALQRLLVEMGEEGGQGDVHLGRRQRPSVGLFARG